MVIKSLNSKCGATSGCISSAFAQRLNLKENIIYEFLLGIEKILNLN